MTGARLGTAALGAALMLALVAPAAGAASKVDKKQTKAIVKLDKRTKAADKKLAAAAKQLGALSADLTTTKNGLAGIQAAVPTVIGSLQTLGDAATQLKAGLESAGAGLTQLKTGLETAGAGLTTLSNSFKGSLAAAEYGVAQLYFDSEGDGFEANDAVPGQMLVSSDVPDDGNQATVTGKLLMAVPDGITAKPVTLKVGMRSGEKDGTGAANPAGVAGLMAMTASIIGAPGTTSIGGGNPGAGGTLPLTSAPNAALGGAPVYPIPEKAPRSDATPNPFGFPDAKAIDLTNPATLQTLTGAPGRFTVTNTSGAPAAAIFDVTVRFNDLSASSTDVEQ